MLGEVEILDEARAVSWTKFTIRGYEAKNWRLIHGRDTVKSGYTVAPARLTLDALDYALFCYQTFFLKRLHQRAPLSPLTSLEMQRLISKMLRYADYFGATGSDRSTSERPSGEKAEIFHRALTVLGEGVLRLTSSEDFLSLRECAERRPVDIARRSLPFAEPTLGAGELAPFRETVKSILFAHNTNTRVIVLKDGLTVAEMRGLPGRYRTHFCAARTDPSGCQRERLRVRAPLLPAVFIHAPYGLRRSDLWGGRVVGFAPTGAGFFRAQYS
jgi:hypothetical protein